MIHGNLEGIRQSTLDELEKLYDAQFARDEYLPDRLLNALVRFTMQLNRELLVYLDRNGVVLEIAIGSIASISLPELHLRRNLDRLSGYRCIHTHPGGDARLSDVDVQALRLLRFDSMCSVGVAEGRATGIMAAFLGEAEYDRLSIVTFGPVKPGRIPQSLWMREIEAAEERVQRAIERGGLTETAERAMLISTDSEDSLDELAALAETAGALVVSRVLQKRQRPDPGTFIGSGKAEELALDCQALEVDLAILDDELTGAQQRNLENALGVRVIDRTALILDIFAARAQTAEGKLQVELAQMNTACRGWWVWGSRSPAWAAASARAVPARRGWKWIAAACASASTTWKGSLPSSSASATCAARAAKSRTRPWWRWWATPTPASPRCSTRSPGPTCWWRTSCLPRSTR